MKPLLAMIEIETFDKVKFQLTFDGPIDTDMKGGIMKTMPSLNEIYQKTGDLILTIDSQIKTFDCLSVLFRNLYGLEHQLIVRRVRKWNAVTERFTVETTLNEKREWITIGITMGQRGA